MDRPGNRIRRNRLCLAPPLALLLASPLAAAETAVPAPNPIEFFVTSAGLGDGANLGGLAGADRHCRKLATEVGAGHRSWRAYLSTGPAGGEPGVDARSRIGPGPWRNAKGVIVARDLEELHSDRNRIDRHTALTEKGEAVIGRFHDILTGSGEDGRTAYVGEVAATCSNWTGNGDGAALMGHHDRYDSGERFPRWNRSWNSAHPSRGCDAERVRQTGSNGLFYCFASDPAPLPNPAPAAPAPPPAGERFRFRRGLNLAHWLSHNVLPDYPYAGSWFDEEDVAWIAAQGFDHLRVRVGGDQWIDKTGDLDEAKIAPFDQLLAWSRKHHLGVVLTMFGLPGYRTGASGVPDPQAPSPFADEETQADAEYLWWQVARRYAGEGDQLRFELLHRPTAESAESLAQLNRLLLAAVRRTNPSRVVYLAPRRLSPDYVDDVDLSDPNTALLVDFWEPRAFTFQYDPTGKRPLVRFPGRVPDFGDSVPPDDPLRRASNTELNEADLGARAERLAAWGRAHAPGHEIYIGEFGVYQRADDESARAFVRAARAALERNGLGWAVYDYQSGCAVRGEDGKPTRILDGLALRAPR